MEGRKVAQKDNNMETVKSLVGDLWMKMKLLVGLVIAGLAVGMSSQGLRPVAEIQFLGFIYADGCNTRKGLAIGIHHDDIDVLNFIKDQLGIEDAVVFSIPDEKWGAIVAAVIVGNCEISVIQKSIEKELGKAAVPRIIKNVQEIPLLPNGKVDIDSLK